VAFANPLPWWVFVLVTAAAAGLSWHAYRRFADWPARRYPLSALRFVILMAIVVVLMRPVARLSGADARDTVIPILVDTATGRIPGWRWIRINTARRCLPSMRCRWDLPTSDVIAKS